MINKISIRWKIFFGFFLVIGLSAVLFIQSYPSLLAINRLAVQVIPIMNEINSLQLLNERFESLTSKLEAFLLISTGQQKQLIENDLKDIESATGSLAPGLGSDENFVEYRDKFGQLHKKILTLLTDKQEGRKVNKQIVTVYKAIEEIKSLQKVLVRGKMRNLQYNIDQQRVGVALLIRKLLVLECLIVFLGLLSAMFLSSMIISNLLKLQQLGIEVSKGNLSKSIVIESRDAIGDLANTLNVMVENLRTILTNTIEAVRKIMEISRDMTIASHQQASGVNQQSTAIAAATSTAEELSKSAEMVGENIRNVIGVTEYAYKGMTKIKDLIGNASDKVNSLGESSQQISNITFLIDEIADQTNFLAINAAIEAARAGEHGKGFAVVSDEIRKLADSTADSVKDINDLIEVIRGEIVNTVAAMEESVQAVDEEIDLSRKSAKSAQEIAVSAAEQLDGARVIADTLTEINNAMQQMANTSRQANTMANELKGLAVDLEKISSKFNL